MARLNALKMADALRERLVDTALSSHYVRDSRLEALLRTNWSGPKEDGGLVAEPWVESAAPPRPSGLTLQDLCQQGKFSPELTRVLGHPGGLPTGRSLHKHQLEAIEAAPPRGGVQPALVVTAGTGYGKTESFLLPLLHQLWERPRTQPGVRALILYPMNALVNDQLERLDGWLSQQTRLSMCRFTGETPEDRQAAKRGTYRLGRPHHRVTRYQARGWEDDAGNRLDPDAFREAPDILITNYSMLEYMLARPQDQSLFGPALQTIVLDEAHLYTSTLAAEITLLLRRFRQRCGVESDQVLSIATSATIGSGASNELEQFAGTLFSRNAEDVTVIRGTPAPLELPEERPGSGTFKADPQFFTFNGLTMDADGNEQFVANSQECAQLAPLLESLVDPAAVQEALQHCEDRPAFLLYHALRHAPAYHRLARQFYEKPYAQLDEVAQLLWNEATPDAQNRTVALLGLLAAARLDLNGLPLFPHRLHLRVRPPAGFHVCLNPACCGPIERKMDPFGCLLGSSADTCPYCHSAVLALVRCNNCGDWMLGGQLDEERHLKPLRSRPFKKPFLLGAVRPEGKAIALDPFTGTVGQGILSANLLVKCPTCNEGPDELRLFQDHHALYQSVVAETMLLEIPPLFGRRASASLPAQGRRLLAFSDSRRSAARLGPELRRQHETKLLRGVLAELLATSAREVSESQTRLNDTRAALQANPVLQHVLGPAIKDLEEKVYRSDRVETWLERMGKRPELAQLFDPQRGLDHRAADWSDSELARMQQAASQLSQLGPRLARDLAVPLRGTHQGLEASGMAELTYPGLESLSPPDELLAELPAHSREKLTANWSDLLASLLDTVRLDGRITIGTREMDAAAEMGNRRLGLYSTPAEFAGKTERGRRRVFVQSVLEEAGIEATEAQQLTARVLESIYAQLCAAGSLASTTGVYQPGRLPWLEVNENFVIDDQVVKALRLRLVDLGLRRPPQLWRCSVSGTIWPRSVLGCAPQAACKGKLEPVTHEELDAWSATGRVRREALDLNVFRQGLWAEEHSAQLTSPEATRLQDLFKAGMRNLLSCTTTMELGIDIGGLSGTFLANVPPSKANYLQRAGRVGRRGDGSSVVVTICRLQTFDQEVFHRFRDFMARPLRRPTVSLDRERIVTRHFHAWLMGEFFRQLYHPRQEVGAMAAFGKMTVFAGEPTMDRDRQVQAPSPFADAVEAPSWWSADRQLPLWKNFLLWVDRVESEQARWEPVLRSLFAGTPVGARLGNDWSSPFGPARERLRELLQGEEGWIPIYRELLEAYPGAGRDKQISLRKRMEALDSTVIEHLSSHQYLPRYGFPVGLQRLMVQPKPAPPGERRAERFRLERAGLMAIREYVPGSHVVAGGQTLTSHGILMHWSGSQNSNPFGVQALASKCRNGHFFYTRGVKLGQCPHCEGEPTTEKRLLFPRHGYSTASWDPPTWSVNPEQVGEVTMVSMGLAGKKAVRTAQDFGEVLNLSASYTETGELLGQNGGNKDFGFAICTKCGYSEPESAYGQLDQKIPRGFHKHWPVQPQKNPGKCWKEGEVTVMRNVWLSAEDTTDVLLLDWSALGGAARNDVVLDSLGEALRLAGARLLELDGRDLGVMLVPQNNSSAIMVYDNVPGGAGHVLELYQNGQAWLQATRELLWRDADHHARCQSACFDCILSYGVQEKPLRRKAAWELLEKALQ